MRIPVQKPGFPSPSTKKLRRKVIKRGKRKSRRSIKNNKEKIMFIGANSAGISNKLESLHRIINVFNPGALFLQETKLRQKGK